MRGSVRASSSATLSNLTEGKFDILVSACPAPGFSHSMGADSLMIGASPDGPVNNGNQVALSSVVQSDAGCRL